MLSVCVVFVSSVEIFVKEYWCSMFGNEVASNTPDGCNKQPAHLIKKHSEHGNTSTEHLSDRQNVTSMMFSVTFERSSKKQKC